MKKKLIVPLLILLFIITSIPIYQNWPYIRFWLGYRIVTSPEGARFVVNQIQIDLRDDAIRQDAEEIARVVNGKIIGEVSSVQLYLFEVPSRTEEELRGLIDVLENLHDPRIETVTVNHLFKFDY